MTDHEQYDGDGRESALSRRRFIAAAGVAAGAGVAGCTEEQDTLEFEAQAIHLPEGDREELVLAETGQDSHEETREPDEVDGEVTITSHVAAYRRGPARGQPTLIEKFLGQVNGTEGAGPAAVVPKREFEIDGDRIRFDYVDWIHEEAPFSLVVPGGVRSGDAASQPIPSNVMVLAGLTPSAEVPLSSGDFLIYNGDLMDGDFLPRTQWMPEDRQPLVKQWFPESGQGTFDFQESDVLVSLGDRTPEEVFGVSAEEMPGERVEDGESVTPDNPFLVAAPGSQFVTGTETLDQEPGRYDELVEQMLAAGSPAPTGGATFGQGVLSTPRAEVAGEVRNPYATEDLGTLLGPDRGSFTKDVLSGVLGIDAENVEWVAGPDQLTSAPLPAGPARILDQEAELQTFAGVVSGENGPWFVGLHATRVEHEGDAVIAVSGQRTPVGDSNFEPTNKRYDNRWFTSGAELTAETSGRLYPMGTNTS